MNTVTRRILPALVCALSLAACGGQQTTKLHAQATGTPVAQDPRAWLQPMDVERELLEDYFKKREAAFESGTDQGVHFLVDHNVAGLGATVESCKNRWFGQNPQEHVREMITPKWDTLRRDPTWTMSVGPRAGQPLGDDIFVIVVGQELLGDQFLSSSHQSKMHFQIHGNGVRNLVLCEPIKTIEVERPGQDPVLEDIPNVPIPEVPTYTPVVPPATTPQFPQPQVPALPPTQPIQPQRPGAPIVLPPIQATGRPIVRPTPNKPSQSPTAQATPQPQPPAPQPTTKPTTPATTEPKPPSTQPTPSTKPSAKPTADQKPAPKPLPEAPDTSTGGEGRGSGDNSASGN